ncbi:MAG: FeoA family protein [Planctomycetota bacterium]|nr:FeoA family protein [Planctomycetota bacterium]
MGATSGECVADQSACRGPGCQGAAAPALEAVAAIVDADALALTTLEPGRVGVVRQVCRDEKDAALLRAMGLRVDAVVRVCRVGEPCIVEVLYRSERCGECTCRLGLSRPLAEQVMVSPTTLAVGAGFGPGETELTVSVRR